MFWDKATSAVFVLIASEIDTGIPGNDIFWSVADFSPKYRL